MGRQLTRLAALGVLGVMVVAVALVVVGVVVGSAEAAVVRQVGEVAVEAVAAAAAVVVAASDDSPPAEPAVGGSALAEVDRLADALAGSAAAVAVAVVPAWVAVDHSSDRNPGPQLEKDPALVDAASAAAVVAVAALGRSVALRAQECCRGLQGSPLHPLGQQEKVLDTNWPSLDASSLVADAALEELTVAVHLR